MSFNAKLLIDEKEITILYFSLDFSQGSDVTGRPSQKPVFNKLVLTLETRKDINFYDWMLAKKLGKAIKIHITPRILGGRTRKISFYDAHLVHLDAHFSATSNMPASETLTITAAGVEDTFSAGVYAASWRTTFNESEVEATVIQQEYEPIFLGYFFEDAHGETIELKDIKSDQKITLVIETENADGETIDLDLKNNKLDYIYDGVLVENDIIKNVIITGEETRIELKTIKEEY